jgi:hypothetical protein
MMQTARYATAALLASLLICEPSTLVAEDDLVKRVRQSLPDDWSIVMDSAEGHVVLKIVTPTMGLRGSARAQGEALINSPLKIRIRVLPKYSKAMLAEIRKHNEPIHEKLKTVDYYSDEYRILDRELIDEPTFADASYGYRIEFLSYVPARAEDQSKLVAVFQKIAADWSVVQPGKDKTAVLEDVLIDKWR